jgi:hypothetical protein
MVWRSDKYSNGRYAESNRYPDLELKQVNLHQEMDFAVECKWRKQFYNGQLKIADACLDYSWCWWKSRKSAVGLLHSTQSHTEYYVIPIADE